MALTPNAENRWLTYFWERDARADGEFPWIRMWLVKPEDRVAFPELAAAYAVRVEQAENGRLMGKAYYDETAYQEDFDYYGGGADGWPSREDEEQVFSLYWQVDDEGLVTVTRKGRVYWFEASATGVSGLYHSLEAALDDNSQDMLELKGVRWIRTILPAQQLAARLRWRDDDDLDWPHPFEINGEAWEYVPGRPGHCRRADSDEPGS